MKPIGGKYLLESKVITPAECLRYALSQPTSVVIHGMESMAQLDHALEVIRAFEPLNWEQISAMADKTRQAAMTGKYELFKTTSHFDATAKNPSWLE